MLTTRQRERLGQRVASVMCVLLIISGAFYLHAGVLDYPNWWGGRVFAPFAVGIGALGLVAMGVRGRKLGRNSK